MTTMEIILVTLVPPFAVWGVYWTNVKLIVL